MKTEARRAGYWDREKETMSAAARERYQARWLGRLVEHAVAQAPGVRRRFERAGLRASDIESVGDLVRLPVIKKSEMPQLQQADPPFGGFCAVPTTKLRRIFVSPGPILEPMGPEISAWHCETALYAGGFRAGDIVIDTFLYHLVPAAHELDEALNLIGCTVVPTGVGNTDTQLMVAKTVRATGYVGTPSFLMTILEKAKEMGLGPLNFEVAQLGAEPFPESMRKVLEREHGIMARQSFGTADLGIIGYECPAASGMHLVDDAIVQVCDPQTCEPLPAGQIGEIVTTVNNYTYPMLRFATGDLTILDDSRCPCGRTAPRMLGWRGRADEVTKVRGMFIHPRQADEVAARVTGLARYQAVVRREGHQDTLTFRVELAPGTEPGALTTALEHAIRDIMKVRGGVEIVPPETLSATAKKITDERTWD